MIVRDALNNHVELAAAAAVRVSIPDDAQTEASIDEATKAAHKVKTLKGSVAVWKNESAKCKKRTKKALDSYEAAEKASLTR